jgi:hypothetical protein
MIDCMQRLEAAAAKPWPQAQAESTAIVDEVEYAAGSVTAQSRYAVTTRIISSLKGALGAALNAEARSRAAAAALAVERYRRKHGDWPRALAQVTPEFLNSRPVDPFDGSPLRYVVAAP